jgi:hypothetical protein
MPELRLWEDQKKSRRTIADALEVLRVAADFQDHDRAEVRVLPLRLPSGHIVGMIDVLFDAPAQETVFAVALPTAARCRAISDGAPQRTELEINRLDGAVVDAMAHVHASDATLRAVEVVPFPLPYEPSGLDWRIIHAAVAVTGNEHRCYRNFRYDVPPQFQHGIPDKRVLDCSRLFDLDLPPLKVVAWLIRAKDDTLHECSDQKIADALRSFGVRIPNPRPRRK